MTRSMIDGHGLTADRLADAGAGGGHAGLQAGDLDGQHSPLVPTHLGNDDGLAGLPASQRQGGGIHFLGGGEIEHDDASGGEFRAGGEKCGSGQALGLSIRIGHRLELLVKLATNR